MNFAEYPLNTESVRLTYVVCGIGTSDGQHHIIREQGMCVHQFMFTVSGSGTVRCGDKEYELPAGWGAILPAGISHEYYPHDGAKWVLNWVIFAGEGISDVLDYYELDGSYPVKLSSLMLMEDIFHRCSGIIRTKDRLCIHRASPLLCEMINELYISAAEEAKEESDKNDIISAAMEYIEKNYSSDITLDHLAELSGVGREYFCTIFRRRTGMRPFEYIATVRIREAKKLLAYSELPVSEIGRRVGYADKSYFGHVFKRLSGMSPTSFRGH